MRARSAILCVAIAACASTGGGGPVARNGAEPVLDESVPGFWLWFAHGAWHLRTTTGGHRHRFQGSVEGLERPLADLRLTSDALAEHAALDKGVLQFDYESHASVQGADFRTGCIRIDLFLDEKRHADKVYVGAGKESLPRLPIDRCPPDSDGDPIGARTL